MDEDLLRTAGDMTRKKLQPMRDVLMAEQTDIHQRRGSFSIDRLEVEAVPGHILAIMGNMIILRCELMACSDRYEYFAISDLFDVCDVGGIAPCYDIITTKVNGKVTVVAERSGYGQRSV